MGTADGCLLRRQAATICRLHRDLGRCPACLAPFNRASFPWGFKSICGGEFMWNRTLLVTVMTVTSIAGFSYPASTAFGETGRFPPTMKHTPFCDRLARQFNAVAQRPVPPEFGRHLSNTMSLIFSSKFPESACHDADVYWNVRSETQAIQRKLVEECDGVWRDQETGKVSLSRDNIDQVYGDEERRFRDDRQKICGSQ